MDPVVPAEGESHTEADGSGDPKKRHPSSLEVTPAVRGRRRNRWVLVSTVALAVAMLSSLLAFGLSRDPTVVRSVLLGRQAPDFELHTLQGSDTVRLSGLRGQVVVVNFWASWCADCRVEHQSIADAWQRYRDQGVVFLGIPFEDTPSASLAFQRELGGGWPILDDPGSRTAVAYGVYGVPETFVIGRAGVVAYKQVGPVSYDVLTEQISRTLPESS